MTNPHIEIHIGAEARLVRAQRTDEPLGSASDVADMVAYARAALQGVARGEHAILIDVRRALLVDES